MSTHSADHIGLEKPSGAKDETLIFLKVATRYDIPQHFDHAKNKNHT